MDIVKTDDNSETSMPETNKEFNIYGLMRAARGLTVSEVACRSGINQSYLSQIEAGKKTPSAKTKAKIAAALRISPDIFEAFDFPEAGPNFFERALLRLLTKIVT